MLKGIVFDLDGTLVNSMPVTFEAFNQSIVQLGGRPHSPDEISQHFGNGEKDIFSLLVGPEKAQPAYEVFKRFTDSNLSMIEIHEGVDHLLENLKSHSIPISIFTGRNYETAEMILSHHRLLDRFITIIANDHVDAPKPSCEGLRLALSHMKMDPHEVLFVGDSHLDMAAAQSANSHGVAALWDLMADRKLLSDYDPKHWAEHPREIWEIWQTY